MARARKSKAARMMDRQRGITGNQTRKRDELVEMATGAALKLGAYTKHMRRGLWQDTPAGTRQTAAATVRGFSEQMRSLHLVAQSLRGMRARVLGSDALYGPLDEALAAADESRNDAIAWFALLETRCAADVLVEMLGDNARPACAEMVQPDDELLALAAQHLEAAAGDPATAGRTLGIALRDRGWVPPDASAFYDGIRTFALLDDHVEATK